MCHQSGTTNQGKGGRIATSVPEECSESQMSPLTKFCFILLYFMKYYFFSNHIHRQSDHYSRGDQLLKVYEYVAITPDILKDIAGSDTQSEDEIEPEKEDYSTDEDND
ncbi:unnamed protein product [Euphydryas editha]|uniref:Uncharacterized protein n=1 Tax=Euphydryas editha TaxID=104508 RepID=A0AAU9UX45_EUPED|nr:unnamed protein product [Euphydryas editha]